jgi:hypothetical protein
MEPQRQAVQGVVMAVVAVTVPRASMKSTIPATSKHGSGMNRKRRSMHIRRQYTMQQHSGT